MLKTNCFLVQEMGFAYAQSERAIRLYGNVQAALDAILAGKGKEWLSRVHGKNTADILLLISL